MTDDTLVMPTEQEELQLQIDESRAALNEKLELLEVKVSDTVQAATASVAEATASVVDTVNNATASVSETVGNVNAAVQGTVETVRNSVAETVASVKETFDLPEQVRKYPWHVFAGAIAVGYIGGRYLQPASGSTRNASDRIASGAAASLNGSDRAGEHNGFHTAAAAAETHPDDSAAAVSSWTDYIGDTFGAEIAKLRGLAIGTSLGLARDLLSSSAPPALRTQIAEIVDGFTSKLGGQRIPGPVLPLDDVSRSSNGAPEDPTSNSPPELAVERVF